jgi:hypothetical protein
MWHLIRAARDVRETARRDLGGDTPSLWKVDEEKDKMRVELPESP